MPTKRQPFEPRSMVRAEEVEGAPDPTTVNIALALVGDTRVPAAGRLPEFDRMQVHPLPVVGGITSGLYFTPAGTTSVLPLCVPSPLIAALIAV
jgi:hypothetical protein